MTIPEPRAPQMAWAIARYEVVGRYLAQKAGRGLKYKVMEELAQETWSGPDGEPFTVSAETIRVWVRRYRRSGLHGLADKEHGGRGTRALSEEHCQLVCALKREVPERSLERIIKVAEDLGKVEKGVLRRSTVHRVLADHGLSARGARLPDKQDIDRYEAKNPNDIWQSDMLFGPWLPDPERPGKTRQTKLYAFLDDHSRLCLHGRFSFNENLPHLELVFRRALQRWGIPSRVYYDNGKVYRSDHMKQICGYMGIQSPIFTKVRRPEGHGKIEAFNRYVRSAFIAELKASHITTLDKLNEAFNAWVDLDYNKRVHSEIKETPLDRWNAGVDSVRFAEEERTRQAFLWKESRTPDKSGVFSLLGVKYQASTKLARRKIEVRFDPEALHEIELWLGGVFHERVKPYEVKVHRRAAAEVDDSKTGEVSTPTADYLGHIVAERRKANVTEPSPRELADNRRVLLEKNAEVVTDLLIERLAEGVLEISTVRDFVLRFGPFDIDAAESALDDFLAAGHSRDLHVMAYLNLLPKSDQGGAP